MTTSNPSTKTTKPTQDSSVHSSGAMAALAVYREPWGPTPSAPASWPRQGTQRTRPVTRLNKAPI